MRRATLLAMVLASAAFAAKPGLDTSTIWEMRGVADPQITKDGKSVIYVLGFNDKMSDQKLSNLWMVSNDGKDNRNPPAGDKPSDRPSPNGSVGDFLRDLFPR